MTPVWSVDESNGHGETEWTGCDFPMPVCWGLAKGSNTSCILQSKLCDGNEDCDDGSDENQVFCHALIVAKLFIELDKTQDVIEWTTD